MPQVISNSPPLPHSNRPAVRVHSLDQALTAAAEARQLGVSLRLESAPGAGGAAGVGWWRELERIVRSRFPDLDLNCVLDCAEEAGTVLAAFRRGINHVRFTGNDLVRRKLQAIAGGYGAELEAESGCCLDLGEFSEPACACREWLAAGGDTLMPPEAHEIEKHLPGKPGRAPSRTC